MARWSGRRPVCCDAVDDQALDRRVARRRAARRQRRRRGDKAEAGGRQCVDPERVGTRRARRTHRAIKRSRANNFEEIRKRVNEEVDRSPEAAAAILRRWLAENRSTETARPGASNGNGTARIARARGMSAHATHRRDLRFPGMRNLDELEREADRVREVQLEAALNDAIARGYAEGIEQGRREAALEAQASARAVAS